VDAKSSRHPRIPSILVRSIFLSLVVGNRGHVSRLGGMPLFLQIYLVSMAIAEWSRHALYRMRMKSTVSPCLTRTHSGSKTEKRPWGRDFSSFNLESSTHWERHESRSRQGQLPGANLLIYCADLCNHGGSRFPRSPLEFLCARVSMT